MHHNEGSFTVSLLSMVIVSLSLATPVHAAGAWFGNDDGEFDASGNYLTYAGLNESFSYSMQWSSSPPSNLVSMQYNPDYAQSLEFQNSQQWFQTAIIVDQNGCGSFTIQVYSLTTSHLVGRSDQAFSQCSLGFLGNGALWTIKEGMVASNLRTISEVDFSITDKVVTSSARLNPSSISGGPWYWLLSNLCWCGTDGGSTTFVNAQGTSTTYASLNLNAIDPPLQPSTAEDSNMYYGSFYSSGTTSMFQNFGWPPSCPGTGCGSVAAGTLIRLANGSQVPVQNLREGMRLLSYDMTSRQFVTTTLTRFATVLTNNAMVIKTTTGKPLIVDQNPEQELYALLPDGKWTLLPVTELQVGDKIFEPMTQTWTPIASIQYQNGGNHIMYDLYPTAPGNYIANGYLDPKKTGPTG